MTSPVREKIATRINNLDIQVTDDGSRTLLRSDTGDAYHSGSGALSETRHVYLGNSGIAQRLADQQSTSVLEIGLGTGMAMLLTLDQAVKSQAVLRYVAVEHQWMPADVLRQLNPQTWIDDQQVVADYLEFRESLGESVARGVYDWNASPAHCISIHASDVLSWRPTCVEQFDAIYFDPFAPTSCTELWTADVFVGMRELLAAGGKFVTYCVSRTVRDALESAGFRVQRVAGPANGKREVLVAT